jgi:predicted nucleic acid-binding protein
MRFALNVLVADASSIVDFLIRRKRVGDWVAELLKESGIAHCPHLVDVEVASSLRRLTSHGDLDVTVAERALSDFIELRIQRYPMTLLLGRLWSLRESLSAYDAAYVALAEALNFPLLTTDQHLARSRGHNAEIVLFPG